MRNEHGGKLRRGKVVMAEEGEKWNKAIRPQLYIRISAFADRNVKLSGPEPSGSSDKE